MKVRIETYFDGHYWCARGIDEDLFSQARSRDELYENIRKTITRRLDDPKEPVTIVDIAEGKSGERAGS